MKPQTPFSEFRNLAAVYQEDASNRSSLGSSNDDCDQIEPEIMIGRLTASQRKAKVDRYLEKKRRKSKMVRYECRKNLAQRRLRYQGRFISAKEAETLDKNLIYDPKDHLIPKPIFHTFKDITRWKRKLSIQKELMNSSSDSLAENLNSNKCSNMSDENCATFQNIGTTTMNHDIDSMDVDDFNLKSDRV